MKAIIVGVLMVVTNLTCFGQDIYKVIFPVVISGKLSEDHRYETVLYFSSVATPESITISGFNDDGGDIGICMGFGGSVPIGITVYSWAGEPSAAYVHWLCPFGGFDSFEAGWMQAALRWL